MFHEIKSDTSLGVRVSGRPITRLSDGREIHGRITLDNCRNCPTIDGTFAVLWPEVNVASPPPPHDLVTSTDVFAKNEVDETVERGVAWQEMSLTEALQAKQRELLREFESHLYGGYVMAANGSDYWLSTSRDATDRRGVFHRWIQINGWPLKEDGVTPQKIPVYLLPQSGVGMWDKVKVNESQWNAILSAEGEHFFACTQTADNLDDDLLAAYDGGAGTTADIAAVDVVGAPWPPTPGDA